MPNSTVKLQLTLAGSWRRIYTHYLAIALLQPVSSWCPLFLSEYWARSVEKSTGVCELPLCLQLPRILYFHPSPHLAFAAIHSFHGILCALLCGSGWPGASSTHIRTTESVLPSYLSLEESTCLFLDLRMLGRLQSQIFDGFFF